MFDWIASALSALWNQSPWTLILGVIIACLSIFDAFRQDTARREKVVKIITVALTISLLFLQARSDKQAEKRSETRLSEALRTQRSDLTTAFNRGTDQVINATTTTADQIRKDAQQQTAEIETQAKSQVSEIRREARFSADRLAAATLGTTDCPLFLPDVHSGTDDGKIIEAGVINNNHDANMYDVSGSLIEYGFDPATAGWSKIISRQSFSSPFIGRVNAHSLPFQPASDSNTVFMLIQMSTRAVTNCHEYIVLYKELGSQWRIDHLKLFDPSWKTLEEDGDKKAPYSFPIPTFPIKSH